MNNSINLYLKITFLAILMAFGKSIFANTYTVINILDTGAGSLRQAITSANSNPGADTIIFNITGMAPYSIPISSGALPNLTGPTVIDGTTQPGFVSGSQATYVKVGTAYTGTVFSATAITGITIKGLDISYSSPRNGAGIGFTNCNQNFILDNFIQNRRSGIVINGGSDHTIQNNNLLASGENTNEPAIYLLNITQGIIPSGVAMSGNKFGGNPNQSFRIQNMSNLIIGDTSVIGANIIIEDNSGLNATGNGGQYVFYLVNVNNITFDNINMASPSKLQSYGIVISNAATNGNVIVKNCDIKNRWGGIHISGGKDYTIQNNNLKGSGENAAYSVQLANISSANIPSGILMSGNLWGRNGGTESNGGLKISNMNNLTIGDAATGVHIKIEDNSGFNEIAGNTYNDRGALFLENVSNILVDNIDASWSLGGAPNSFGIRINNGPSNSNITIKDCLVRNRYMGILCSDGKDYTIINNDLRGSGWEDAAALSLSSIAQNNIPMGVLVHSNLYGRYAPTNVDPNSIGLYIANMSNLTIGDATTGVEIKIEDNSGMNTFASNSGDRRGCLYLDDVSNITVDNVDLSWSRGGQPNSFGIYVENETSRFSNVSTSHQNVTIKNCDVHNRFVGIRVRGGKDYNIFNNDMRGCGNGGSYSLELGNIQANTIPSGVLVHSNLYGTNPVGPTNPTIQASHAGVYLSLMNNLTIGDAVTGVQIKLEDNSGLNQIEGQGTSSYSALYCNSVNNVTIDNVDCSKATTGQGNSVGIRVVNTSINNTISIKNNLCGNRARGIWIDGGKDYTVTNNNMVGSGNGEAAFELNNILKGIIPSGIIANGNTFGTPNFNRGVVIGNMRNLLIGDASVLGANIVLEDNCGLNQCVGGDYNSHGALYLGNVDSVTIDNVDASKATATASNSYAIRVANGLGNQAVTIKNCKADNRYRGIYIDGGKDYTVQNNTITNSGWDGTANALDFRNIIAGSLVGGVLVSGNTFGNMPLTANAARTAIRFDNMRDLTIGDATTGGNVKIEDGSGLTAIGFDQNSTYSVMYLNNILNATVDDVDFSSTYTSPVQRNNALRISNNLSNGYITVKNNNFQGRRSGLIIGGGKDYTVTGNNFTATGVSQSEPAVYLNGLVKGSIDGGIAMSGNIFGGSATNTALRIEDMTGFTIGDNVSDDVFMDDTTSGLFLTGNIANSNEAVIYMQQVSDITINSLKLSRDGSTQYGVGIRILNGTGNKNISITNNEINNRYAGIVINGGKDYTITNNNFTNSGLNSTNPALHLNGITSQTLTGGVNISGNIFGGTNANTAVRFESMNNLTIGDASTGTNVKLEDGTSGLENVGNASAPSEPVLYFSNVSNSLVDNIILSRSGGTQYGYGLRVENSAVNTSFTIKNNTIINRKSSVYLNGGSGYVVNDNNFSSSGISTNEPALYINAVNFNAGKTFYNNLFGGTNFLNGLKLNNCNNVTIGDSTVTSAQIELKLSSNVRNASNNPVEINTSTNINVENLDLSFTGIATGTGLNISSGSNVKGRNLTISKRVDGVSINGGTNHQVLCSNLSLNTDGIQIISSTGNIIENCSFVGNTSYAINSNAAVNAENNYFGGAAPPVGTPNGVTASVDATPFLAAPPSSCPTTLLPEIEVIGNSIFILDGSISPSTSNYTDLGTVKTSSSITRTYTINNLGGAALNVSSISFSGTHASEFVAGALTPASPIPAYSSATFTVTFTPNATGLRTAQLDIVNNDADEAAFDAAFQGTGKAALVVTKVADTNDGVCDADCSLREAITVANSNADADVIEFAIGSGAQTILNATAYPTITNPVIINGASQPGFAGIPLITLNTTNGTTTLSFINLTGATVKSMNLSRPTTNYDGTGMSFSNCNEVTIIDNKINNRNSAITVSGGRDFTIQNNNFKSSGFSDGTSCVWLNNISSRDISKGIKMSGNIWGYDSANAPNSWNIGGTPLRIDNMNGLIIGDASVLNANITLEDGTSGLTSTGYNQSCCETSVLYFSNVSDMTIDNVDLSHSYPSPFSQGIGRAITIVNGTSGKNVTIKNCTMQFRNSGINIEGGYDYTIQNNDIRNTGRGEDDASIRLGGIQSITIPGGVIATGNQFGVFGGAGGTNKVGTALRLVNLSNLTIGDASVSGANIVINDGELNDFWGFDPQCCHRNVFSFTNVSDVTVDNIDLDYTATAQQLGFAISVTNSANNKNVSIKNCTLRNRIKGIQIIGGKDYTITNNDMRNVGADNSNPAIYLSGVKPGLIPSGVLAHTNKFGTPVQSAKTVLRVDGMDGLLIGDALVSNANITIEDNSGANTMNNDGDQAVIYMNGVSNITIDNVDISRSASGRTGAGIWIDNSASTVYNNITVRNCKIQQRDMSLFITGGKDATITDNDLRYSGFYTDRATVWLNSIVQGTLTGGVKMSGNLFGGTSNGSVSEMGLRIDNMRDLIIGDATVSGRNITLEDTCGLNATGQSDVNNRGALYMNGVTNVTIDNVDLSRTSQTSSFALIINTGINIIAKNNYAQNRFRGFQFNGGRDITVRNNDLRSSGNSRDYPAIHFTTITSQNIPSGISGFGNLFGGANTKTALRIDNMENILIGDENVIGANFIVEDASGTANFTQADNNSEHPVFYMTNVSNFTVDNLNAPWPTSTSKEKGGISIINNTNNHDVTIKNCNFNNHFRAIYCSGGKDYSVINNSLLNSGASSDQPAIHMQNIQGNNLMGGVLMNGNTFGGTLSFGGVKFENMRDLIIGNASVVGRNITFEDNSGLNNLRGNGSNAGYYVLHLNNVHNVVIDNVDVSRPSGSTPAQDFTGIRIDNNPAHGPITIKNTDLRRHRIGINIQGGKDFTITNNDLRGSGVSSEEPAIYVNNITQIANSVPMGFYAQDNKFGPLGLLNSSCGIRLENVSDLKFSNVVAPGNNIVVKAMDSLKFVLGTSGNFPGVISLRNVSEVTVDSIDLSFTGTQTGIGINIINDYSSQFGNKFSNNIIKNRRIGLRVVNGSDLTITGNNFQMSGAADDESALRIDNIAEGSMPGGLLVSNNTFGGAGALFALKLLNMSNLKISDGTFPATNVNLGSITNNGFNNVTTGYVIHLSSISNSTVSNIDLSRSGIVRQGTGIRLTSGFNNTIQKVYAQGRDIGMTIVGSSSEMIKCNTFYDNNFGIDFTNAATNGLTFNNNSVMCNSTGMRSVYTSNINATGNYWGAADGPITLGGSGNGYSGLITATGFLNNQAACAPKLPDADAFGNNLLINDGDVSPSFDDNTLVCGIPVGQNTVTQYKLKNNGTGTIILNGPSPVTISPNTIFTVDSQPTDLELAAGDSTYVGIKFTPTSVGLFQAVVNVSNRTCDNNPYNFTVQGNGCDPYSATLSRDTTFCIGTTISVKINIVGGLAPFNVKLSDGNTYIVNSTGINYIIVTPTVNTTYSIVQVTDANNCCATVSGTSAITLATPPIPSITVTDASGTTPNDAIICSGSSAILDAGAYSAWSWSNSETTQTTTVFAAGTYTVMVTDMNGCTGTDSQLVTVNSNPTPTITVTETSGTTDDDGILCSGDAATLNVGVHTAYLWSTTETSQSISVNSSNTFTVTVTDNNACSSTDDINILVNPLPVAALSGTTTVCPVITSSTVGINITVGTPPFIVVLSDASIHNVATLGNSNLTVTVSGPSTNSFTITSIKDANDCLGTGSGTASVEFGAFGEIEITGQGIPINDGSTSPTINDDTNFGQINISSDDTHTFTIHNSDVTKALSISGVTITGSSDFSIVSLPAGSVNMNGGTTSFQIKYTPSILGIVTATVIINSSDCDEDPYTFLIQGEGSCIAPSFTTCPSNINRFTSATCDTIVNYLVAALGVPTPSLTYTFSGATIASGSGTGTGSTFNKGTTTVSITATSLCNTAICSFDIIVTDNRAPSIICAGPVTINNTPGLCTGTISLIKPTVTDNCSLNSLGNALHFDGVDDYVSTANFTNSNLIGDLTLEAWFKATSLHGKTIVTRDFTTDFDITLWFNQLNYYHGDGSNYINLTFSYIFNPNTWYHVAVVRNISAKTVSLYVNGVFQQTLGWTSPAPSSTNAPLYIGRRACCLSFDGSIDEVRIWNVQRSATEIVNNMNNELSSSESGLLHYFKLNDGLAGGNNTTDTIANATIGLNAILHNFALNCATTSNYVAGQMNTTSAMVTNNSPCVYPIGNTTVTWTATDGSGNTSTCTQVVTVVDNKPPTAICQNTSIPLNIVGLVNISASSIDNGSNDECGISSLSLNQTSFTCAHVGVNSVVLTVTDVNTNSSTCVATVTVQDTLDPTALCQNVTVQLNSVGNGNTSASAVNNGSSDACGVASLSLNTSSFTCANVGANTVVLTVTDVNGNFATCSSIVTVVDTIDPVAICQSVTVQLNNTGNGNTTASAINNGSSDACGVVSLSLSQTSFTCANVGTNSVVLTVTDVNGNTNTCSSTITVEDSVAPAANCQNVTVQLNNIGTGSTTASAVNNGSSDACGIASLSLNTTSFTCANIGTNPVVLTVTDVNGNTNTCSSTITVEDNVAPTANCKNVTVQLNNVGTGSTTASAVNNGSSDACGIASLSLNNSSFTCANVGTNPVVLTVTDVNGNTNTCSSTITVEDNVAPTANCQNVTVQLNNVGTGNTTASAVNNGSSDACGITSLSLNTTSFTCANVGTNPVVLTVTDVNGNTNTCASTITVEDNVAPTIICQNVTVQLNNVGTGSTTASAVNNGSSDACGIASLSLNNSSFTCANVGTNPVVLTVTDVNGNTNTCSSTITVEDNVAPTANCQNVTVQLNNVGTGNTTASAVNNGSSDACGIASLSLNATSFTCANVGTNPVVLTVTDVNGNTNTCSSTITVEDNVAPTANCQNVTVQLNNVGTGSTTASAVNNGSSDACGITSLSLNTTSFTCANVGANPVVLTITDVNGNTNTCASTITVEDNVAPTANCQNVTVQLNNVGTGSTTASAVNNGSSDACGIASLSLNNSSFTCANVGTNPVVLTVTDVNGNTNTCASTITVEDNVAPTANCQNVTVQLNNVGTGSTTASAVNNGSSDACGIASLSLNTTSFTCVNVGTNPVVLTVTDVNGNTNTCASTITVEDNVAPTANCQNVTVQLNNVGTGSTTASAVNNGSSDACGVASISLNTTSFTCANVGANPVVLTVTDVNGNTNTCASTITVEDNIPPVAHCKDITVMLDVNQMYTVTASEINDMSTDNCLIANLSIESGLISYTCMEVPGIYAVVLKVTDSEGLTHTCSSNVSVIQNTINPCCSGTLTLVGPSSMCPGGTASFTMTPFNVPGGVWSSNNVPVISVDPMTGIVTNNGDVNTSAIITYTVTQQGCNQEVTSTPINVITPNLIQAGNINDPLNWELGCVPSMVIPNGTPIIIDFDLMVPQGTNMDYHGDLIIQALQSVTNNGTLNSHGGKIINNGLYKGKGIFMGDFMNNGRIKPGN